MPTDIYGYFEVRHPAADAGRYKAEPWVCLMSLSPLYSDADYAAFGCLFGIRNWLSWTPVAAGRGLPADVSNDVRADYEKWSRLDGAIHGATWVSWSELRDLDLSVPAPCRGVLKIQKRPSAGHPGHDRWPAGNPEWYGMVQQIRIDGQWPEEVVEMYGVPPIGATPAQASPGSWATSQARFEYDLPTRQDFIGTGTGWEHVFAVMRAFGNRFGADGVRLVVWFD